MFKPTKKQHLVNKNYADKNGGSGADEVSTGVLKVYVKEGDIPFFKGSEIDTIVKKVPIALIIDDPDEDGDRYVYHLGVIYNNNKGLKYSNGNTTFSIITGSRVSYGINNEYIYNPESGNYVRPQPVTPV